MDKPKRPRKASKTLEDSIPKKSGGDSRIATPGDSFSPPKQYETARLPNSFAYSNFFRQPVKQAIREGGVTVTDDRPEVADFDGFDSDQEGKPPFTQQRESAEGRMDPYATHRSFGSVLVGIKTSHLVAVDEEVLVALLTIAAVKTRRYELEPHTGSPEREETPRACLSETEQLGIVIGFDFQRSELAKLLGWGLNKVSYDAIFHSLVRLKAAKFREPKPVTTDSPLPDKKHKRSSRIIGFPVKLYKTDAGDLGEDSPDYKEWIPKWQPKTGKTSGKSTFEAYPTNADAEPVKWLPTGKVTVILCRHLSEIVLTQDTKILYGLHLMSERIQLSPLGRTLYTQIVAQVRPGQERPLHLDHLLRKAKGRFPTASERSAALKILTQKWLKNEGWAITSSGRAENTYLRVIRPPLPTQLQTQRGKRGKKNKNEPDINPQ